MNQKARSKGIEELIEISKGIKDLEFSIGKLPLLSRIYYARKRRQNVNSCMKQYLLIQHMYEIYNCAYESALEFNKKGNWYEVFK